MAIKYRNQIFNVIIPLAVFVLLYHIILRFQNIGFGRRFEADFVRNTWLAGHLILKGENPYDSQLWISHLGGYILNPGEFPSYIYPIWVAILLSPLGLIQPLNALSFWITLNFFFIFFSLKLTYKIRQKTLTITNTATLMLTALLYVPTIFHLLEGQYNFTLLLLFLLSMFALKKDNHLISGLVLSLTTGKPQSSWLIIAGILYWLFRRKKHKAILGFILGVFFLWTFPFLIFPDWVRNWLEVIQWQGGALIEMTPSFWGLSFHIFPSSVAYPIAISISTIFFISLGWWWHKRTSSSTTDIWESAPFTIAGLLTSFYGLLYDQVVLLFPFWLCWQNALSKTWRIILIFWIFILPWLTLFIAAKDPPFNLVFAFVQPLSLLPIYYYLHKN